MKHDTHQVVIVGAGLSGLACGRGLAERGIDFHILEASARVGGRLGSVRVKGVSCDLGFQVSMSNYEALEKLVPRTSLERHGFIRGAVLVDGEKRTRVIDPKSDPLSGLKLLFSGIGGWRDLRAANRCRVLAKKAGQGRHVPGTARHLIESVGFSSRFVESFVRPFFSGVLLDEELDVPAERFLKTLDRFASGRAELPTGGMQELAKSMAAPIHERISFNQEVLEVSGGLIRMRDGTHLTAQQIVLALPFDAIIRLIGGRPMALENEWSSTAAVHFTTRAEVPLEPIIYLNASNTGSLNLACVPSAVAPGIAPKGCSSIIASLKPWTSDGSMREMGQGAISRVRDEAGVLLGVDSSSWQHLHTNSVPRALPRRCWDELHHELPEGVLATGDWASWPSIDASVEGGLKTADLVSSRM